MNRFLAALTSRVASSRSREAPARVAVDAAGAPPPAPPPPPRAGAPHI